VEDVAFVAGFGIRCVAEQKNLAEIAGRGVQAVGSRGERSHLIGFRLKQFDIVFATADFKNLAAVSSSGEQVAVRTESERVHEIIVGAPYERGRAIGRNFVDFRSAGNS